MEEWRRKPLYPILHLDLILVICFDKPCKNVSRNQVGNTGLFSDLFNICMDFSPVGASLNLIAQKHSLNLLHTKAPAH